MKKFVKFHKDSVNDQEKSEFFWYRLFEGIISLAWGAENKQVTDKDIKHDYVQMNHLGWEIWRFNFWSRRRVEEGESRYIGGVGEWERCRVIVWLRRITWRNRIWMFSDEKSLFFSSGSSYIDTVLMRDKSSPFSGRAPMCERRVRMSVCLWYDMNEIYHLHYNYLTLFYTQTSKMLRRMF